MSTFFTQGRDYAQAQEDAEFSAFDEEPRGERTDWWKTARVAGQTIALGLLPGGLNPARPMEDLEGTAFENAPADLGGAFAGGGEGVNIRARQLVRDVGPFAQFLFDYEGFQERVREQGDPRADQTDRNWFDRLTSENIDFWSQRRREMAVDPATRSEAANLVGDLTRVLGTFGFASLATGNPISGAYAASGSFEAADYEHHIAAGVDPETARGAAAITGWSMFAMGLAPVSLAGKLWQRAASGAAINLGFGAGMRGSTSAYLNTQGYPELAEQYQWLDPRAATVDAVLGAAFGALFGRRAPSGVRPHVVADGVEAEAPTLPQDADSYFEEATLYGNEGKHAEAYAYALIAKDLGHPEADGLLALIEEDATPADLETGMGLASEIAQRAIAAEMRESGMADAAMVEADSIGRETAFGIPQNRASARWQSEALAEMEGQAARDEPVDPGQMPDGVGYVPLPESPADAFDVSLAAYLESEGFATAQEAEARIREIRAERGDAIPPDSMLASMGRGRGADEPFFSVVERVVSASTTTRASGAQWLATIRKTPGVKREELDWIGLEDFLAAQEGPVSREDVLAFVRENGVRVEETVLGGASADPELQARLLPLIEERERLERSLDPFIGRRPSVDGKSSFTPEELAQIAETRERISELSREIIPLEQQRADQARGTSTRWSQYALPGGENYRELLLRLPSIADRAPKTPEEARAYLNEHGVDAGARAIQLGGGDVVETARARFRALNPDWDEFRSSHFDQPNIIAHVRFNERVDAEGRRTLFIEEIQSDWGQGLRRQKEAQAQAIAERTRHLEAARASGNAERIAREEELLAQASQSAQGARLPDMPFKANAWASLALKRMIRWAAENDFDQIAWARGESQNVRYPDPNRNPDAMPAFYDRILPNIANDLGKKFGARTGKTRIDASGALEPYISGERWLIGNRQRGAGRVDGTPEFKSKAEAQAWIDENPGAEAVHTLPITPQMREAAMQGMPLFSRQQAARAPFSTVEELQARATEEFGVDWEVLARAGKVEVVQSSADVPAGGYGLPRGVQAVYLRRYGAAYFIANNIRAENLKGLILHEIGVHHGMADMLGERGFRELLRQVDRMVDEEHPEVVRAREWAERYAMQPEHVSEETLAYLIEEKADLPVVNRILSRIRQWLIRTFGTTFGMRLTVDDLRALAVTSLRRAAEQARREAGSAEAVELGATRAPDPAILEEAHASGYTGQDTGEAVEWLRAVEKGLPMDEASRMARADDMGLTTDAYRGLNQPFREDFNQAAVGEFFSDTPEAANSYTGGRFLPPNGGNVMPIRLRRGRTLVVEGDGAKYDRIPISAISDEALHAEASLDGKYDTAQTGRISRIAREAGYDSVTFRDVRDDFHGQGEPATIYNTFRKQDRRSRFAAFDPDYRESADLLASKTWTDLERMLEERRRGGTPGLRRNVPPDFPEVGTPEYAAAVMAAREAQKSGQRLTEMQRALIRFEADSEFPDGMFSQGREAYDKLDPAEQALMDDPGDIKASVGSRRITARQAIEMSVEAQKHAQEMRKGYDAAARCAVRHGGSMAGRSLVTLGGLGPAASTGHLLGMTAAIPVGIVVSNMAAQNADPLGYAARRARTAGQNLSEFGRAAGEAAGLDAPSPAPELLAPRVRVPRDPSYFIEEPVAETIEPARGLPPPDADGGEEPADDAEDLMEAFAPLIEDEE